MIGLRSGFQTFVKHRTSAVKGVHFMIRCQALASKALSRAAIKCASAVHQLNQLYQRQCNKFANFQRTAKRNKC